MIMQGDVVHSVNILVAILLGAVCYYIYYIFQFDKNNI